MSLCMEELMKDPSSRKPKVQAGHKTTIGTACDSFSLLVALVRGSIISNIGTLIEGKAIKPQQHY